MGDENDNDKVIVRWVINAGFPNAKHEGEWEFDRDEWGGWTTAEREAACDGMLNDEIGNYINASYEMPEDNQ